jgi:hypothetical protein
VGIEDSAEAAQDPLQARETEGFVEADAGKARRAQQARRVDEEALPAAHLGEAKGPQGKKLLLETCGGDQPQQIPIGSADLLGAGIEAEALPLLAARPAARAVGALQKRHLASALAQPTGGSQAGDPGADHDDVAAGPHHSSPRVSEIRLWSSLSRPSTTSCSVSKGS